MCPLPALLAAAAYPGTALLCRAAPHLSSLGPRGDRLVLPPAGGYPRLLAGEHRMRGRLRKGGARIDSTHEPLTTPELDTRLSIQQGTFERRLTERRLRVHTRIGPLNLDDPRVRTLVAHLAALAAAVAILVLRGPGPMSMGQILIAIVIGLGFSLLHVLNVQRRLGLSSLLLDAVGMVVLVMGTGGPASPFYVLALAGVWWAAQVPRRRSGLTYGLAFAAAYVLLIVPQALREHTPASAIGNAAAVIIVAVLSDRFVRVDRRALEPHEAPQAPPFAVEHVAVRNGLLLAMGTLAMGTNEIAVDVILAAGRLGLTAIQAELLSYLVIGLSNQEISDATLVSEAAVRYRLTRLYRSLGVRGRREAADRARELGFSGRARTGRQRAS